MKSRKKSKSTKWTIGIAIIATAVTAIALTQLSSNVVYFYTPDEAQAKVLDIGRQTIKVGGMVVPGSVDWKAEQLDLAFTISDLKGHDIRIKHKGTPPDMFKEGQGVVVEGVLEQGGRAMTSRKLMVKHSEEYKKPGDHAGSINKELLEKSLFGGQNQPSRDTK
jgi:cytochrome c-type biogenesis protein CcmE